MVENLYKTTTIMIVKVFIIFSWYVDIAIWLLIEFDTVSLKHNFLPGWETDIISHGIFDRETFCWMSKQI